MDSTRSEMQFNKKYTCAPGYIRSDANKSTTEEDRVRPKMLKVTSSGEKFRYFIEPEDLKQIVESQRSDNSMERTGDESLERPVKYVDSTSLKQFKQQQQQQLYHQQYNGAEPHFKHDILIQCPDHGVDSSFDTNRRAIDLFNLDIPIPQDSSDGLEDVYAETKILATKKGKPKSDTKSCDSTRRKRYTKKVKRSNSCPQSMRCHFGQPDVISLGSGYSLRKSQGYTDISIKRECEVLCEQPPWRKSLTNILFLVILFYFFLASYSYIDELNRYYEKFSK